MGPRSCIDWCRKSSAPTGIQSPDSPALIESPYPRHKGIQREKWYSSTVTSAPDGHQWLPSCPGRFNPAKESRHPLNKSLGGPECLSGCFAEEKNLCPNQDSNPGPSRWYNRCLTDHVTLAPEFHPRTGHKDLALAALPFGKKPYSHCRWDWVGPKTILVWCRKSSAYNRIQSLDPPVCRKSL